MRQPGSASSLERLKPDGDRGSKEERLPCIYGCCLRRYKGALLPERSDMRHIRFARCREINQGVVAIVAQMSCDVGERQLFLPP